MSIYYLDASALVKRYVRIEVPEEILVTQAGCTVPSHCGPNTIGILYMVN